MAYLKFNIRVELRKFLRGEPTKVQPDVLLHLIAPKHLEAAAK